MKFLGFQNLKHERDRQTQSDATRCITMPHSRVVIILQKSGS